MKRLPTDESDFYQILREETLSSIFWERLELKSDTGFPDSHFVLRKSSTPFKYEEGTVEFKFDRKADSAPKLKKLMEPTQQANFLEYFQAGGKRRFLLCCNQYGRCLLYSTQAVVNQLMGTGAHSSSADLYDDTLPVRNWLPFMLGMKW